MIINNVKLVLEDEVVQGSLEIEGGVIRTFAESPSSLPEELDGEGGWLLPGLIELHTDNLDKFFTPRPKVDWPAHSAMSSHDALMVASGITTVLDARQIAAVQSRLTYAAIGGRDTVRDKLAAFAAQTGVDEVMVTGMVFDLNDRIRSLEITAEAVAGL